MFHTPCLEEVGKEMGGVLHQTREDRERLCTNEPRSSGILAHLYYVGPISLAVDKDEELLTTI